MNTLTVPKIKDLVNKPNQQYKDIYDTLQHTTSTRETVSTPSTQNNNNAEAEMTDELSTFLSDLKKTTTLSNTNNTISNNTISNNTISNTIQSGDLHNNDLGYSLY
jgi:hypothetical protein